MFQSWPTVNTQHRLACPSDWLVMSQRVAKMGTLLKSVDIHIGISTVICKISGISWNHEMCPLQVMKSLTDKSQSSQREPSWETSEGGGHEQDPSHPRSLSKKSAILRAMPGAFLLVLVTLVCLCAALPALLCLGQLPCYTKPSTAALTALPNAPCRRELRAVYLLMATQCCARACP